MRQFGRDDVARYLPAVNDSYARISTLSAFDSDRMLPTGFHPSDLCFWHLENRYFHYPFALHSVGLYKFGTRIDNALTRSSKRDRLLLGDSGGFQLGSNSEPYGYKPLKSGLTANEAILAWHDAAELRDWIIGSLTGSCNMGMTIDVPLWAASDTNIYSAFNQCSVDQLIKINKRTLDYIENVSVSQSDFRWLNVIQGLDKSTIDAWINEVNEFRYGGWALGGMAGVRGGIEGVVYVLKRLEALGCFNNNNTWIHVLGVGTAEWAVYLTEIQICLRERFHSIQISFDNATPFSQAGRFERIMVPPFLTSEYATWAIGYENAPQGQVYTVDSSYFSQHSSIGKDFRLSMLNVKKDLFNPNKFDQLSHVVLANHNVYVMLDAFERANLIAMYQPKQLPVNISSRLEFIRGELG